LDEEGVSYPLEEDDVGFTGELVLYPVPLETEGVGFVWLPVPYETEE